MRTVATATLVTRPPFDTLFTIDPDVRGEILIDMRARGFDPSKPIDAWDDGGALVVIDGHTRLGVARELGMAVVPVSAMPYADLMAALTHAIHNQRARRNISKFDLVNAIETVDRANRQPIGTNQHTRREEGSRDPSSSTSSADETAAIVGTSRATVVRARQIYDDEEAKKEVESGASIAAAAKGARARKRAAAPPTEPKSKGRVGDEPWYKAQLAGLGAEVSLIVAMREIAAELETLRADGVSPALMMSDRRVSSAWNKALKQVNAVATVIRGAMRDGTC